MGGRVKIQANVFPKRRWNVTRWLVLISWERTLISDQFTTLHLPNSHSLDPTANDNCQLWGRHCWRCWIQVITRGNRGLHSYIWSRADRSACVAKTSGSMWNLHSCFCLSDSFHTHFLLHLEERDFVLKKKKKRNILPWNVWNHYMSWACFGYDCKVRSAASFWSAWVYLIWWHRLANTGLLKTEDSGFVLQDL